jgi:predicted nucleic acid-binding protein
MILVLDASAAVDVLLSEGKYEEYRKELEDADAVLAPELYASEISNVAWKYRQFADFTHGECIRLAEDGLNLIDTFVAVTDIWKESLREALYNNHPVYDCLYVVCARRNDGMLLTKDKRLRRLCDALKVESK